VFNSFKGDASVPGTLQKHRSGDVTEVNALKAALLSAQ
jgi:hypothetical protein